MGSLSGVKGQFKPGLVPEIKVRYNRGKRVLGNVKSTKEIASFIRLQYKRGTIETQEYFNVMYLNNRGSILGFYQHSKGSITGVMADSRLIFGVALKSLATGIVLSHNHPSGNLNPSRADINVTNKFKLVGELLEIEVIDHIIVTKNGYYSFADNGKI